MADRVGFFFGRCFEFVAGVLKRGGCGIRVVIERTFNVFLDIMYLA